MTFLFEVKSKKEEEGKKTSSCFGTDTHTPTCNKDKKELKKKSLESLAN
jgi:hypothetical protein